MAELLQAWEVQPLHISVNARGVITIVLGAESFQKLLKAQVGKANSYERSYHCNSPGCVLDNLRLELRDGIIATTTDVKLVVPRTVRSPNR